ncbi:ATP synthase F1 subunit gamma [candidate division WWE3 bacterium CG_4_10_14_0_2_um_filter_41_14]|uniref:ATP synthase gamma chain n=1 Tax=candidate division WWE3 bacterium CG_4_10_14_0_2_um_filter_41_14 TaxID=1975072 RepID=A0A2M7TJI4_UNCKA|nr:MAG: ATP synthase F1 subunit gamma [candidate division WWE3 bacterium CG_4_10_14_0_2_um_filter_41_14]
MSKLREIKRRITSVKNIEKVTHAMQMVAASRMKKAQDRALHGKQYTEKIKVMLFELKQSVSTLHPLFDATYSKDAPTVLVVVFSTQRGLAGGLPGTVLRHTLKTVDAIKKQGKNVEVISIGKKIGEQLARNDVTVTADFSHLSENPTTGDIRPITKLIEGEYIDKKVSSVIVIYPDFINPVTYVPVSRMLLPFDETLFAQFDDKYERKDGHTSTGDFVFEPDAFAILDALIPRYLETQMYQARLEAVASEYSARMIAMKSATDNAKSLNDALKLSFNKSRQALITQEISEIVAAGST